MEQKRQLWKMNSDFQNDLLVAEFFRTKNLIGLEELLADGFPLTSYILFMMRANGYSDEDIKSLISKAVDVNENAKKWISEYIDIHVVYELYSCFPELAMANFPSNEECIKYKLWNVLLSRKEYRKIAENVPEIIEQSDDLNSCVALLQIDFNKYASFVWNKGFPNAFLWVKDGWKYLIDQGKANFFLQNEWYGLLPEDGIIEYCLQKGLIDELYEARKYDQLLEHGYYEVFVKNHSSYSLFLEKFPEHVEWEELWKTAESKSDRKYLIGEAFKHPEVQQCSDFLWEHVGFWGKFMLLSGL